MKENKTLSVLLVMSLLISMVLIACSPAAPPAAPPAEAPVREEAPDIDSSTDEVEVSVIEEPVAESMQTETTDEVYVDNTPGIINCDILDAEKFNSITDKKYNFYSVTENGCVFIDSKSGSFLTITSYKYGAEKITVDIVRNDYETLLKAIHDDQWEFTSTEWKQYKEGFQLGVLAFYGPSESGDNGGALGAHGISSSGHYIYISGNDKTSSENYDASRAKLIKLAEEVARQLNRQW